jgi:hypothetical protein
MMLWKWRVTIGFVASILIVAVAFYVLGTRVNSNKDAIYKSCILLSNAIIESTKPMPTTQIVIDAILKNSADLGRPNVKKEYDAAVAEAKAHPSKALKLDCEKASDDPDSIVPITPVDVSPTP